VLRGGLTGPIAGHVNKRDGIIGAALPLLTFFAFEEAWGVIIGIIGGLAAAVIIDLAILFKKRLRGVSRDSIDY
jgi:hypothetical protein